jgi:hypothetical protein
MRPIAAILLNITSAISPNIPQEIMALAHRDE